jgi:Tol biopolymer transport system component
VAYESSDSSLAPADNNRNLDVFVRDLVTGTHELASAHHPSLTTVTPNGPSISTTFSASADGRYIAYASEADDLIAGDTNGSRDVFVRDLATNTNALVSAALGGGFGNGLSLEPAISGDGRYVAFTSMSTNLVANDGNNRSDVFLRDLVAGTTILVSRTAVGAGGGNSNSYSPIISQDGKWVLFRSEATDLVPGSFSGPENLFLFNAQYATNLALTTFQFKEGTMTSSGRYVVYSVTATAISAPRLYIWDTLLNGITYSNATINIPPANLSISPDGRFIAYSTQSSFRVLDRSAQTNWLIASSPTGSLIPPSRSRFDASGRYMTYARTVTPWQQVFVFDTVACTETLISHPADSSSGGGGNSDMPDISPDGRFVAYHTQATNLVAGANGYLWQVVLHDRQTGLNQLVSASRFTGLPGDDHSTRPRFSADGQMLLFQSRASDLVGNDFNRSGDVIAQAILTAVILPPTPGQGPWLYWPFVPGNNYNVQFKNNLNDPLWQSLPGGFTNIGVKAWQQDLFPTNSQRLYRILAY